jgi:two-component system response regulator HydG
MQPSQSRSGVMDEERNTDVVRDRIELRASNLDEIVVGRSASMRRVRDRIAGLAPLRVPVLVVGESGSGRDQIVKAFHDLSAERRAKLVRIRGDSGAESNTPPSTRAIYLDEIAGLAPETQIRWLERLREVEAGAGAHSARLYASTSEDLASRARDGSFHPELAQRLLRFRVELPPLRDRLEDIRPLVDVLVPQIGARLGRRRVRVLPSAIARFKQHTWTGNVRELAEVLERLIAFSADGAIGRAQVEEVLASSPESVSSLRDRRRRKQRDELVALLEACGGNLAEVARRLDMSRGAIVYRARQHGLLPRKKRS